MIELLIAFGAGLISFLSPCVLPLIPVYASLITGMSAKELSQETSQVTRSKLRLTATVKGIMFVIGFSIIFMLLGTTVSFMGNLFFDSIQWIERIGGVILIVLGLHMVGLFKIPRLEKQMRFDMGKRNSGKFGPLVVGMAFGAGWTPCIGPTLGAVQVLAFESATAQRGAILSAAYCLGLGSPFILMGLLGFYYGFNSKKGLIILIMSPIILFKSLSILDSYFQSKKENKYPAIANMISIIFGGAIIFLFINLKFELEYFALIYVFESAVLISALLFFYLWKSELQKWIVSKKISVNILKES